MITNIRCIGGIVYIDSNFSAYYINELESLYVADFVSEGSCLWYINELKNFLSKVY